MQPVCPLCIGLPSPPSCHQLSLPQEDTTWLYYCRQS
jgi:hypothetical protein